MVVPWWLVFGNCKFPKLSRSSKHVLSARSLCWVTLPKLGGDAAQSCAVDQQMSRQIKQYRDCLQDKPNKVSRAAF